MERVVRILSAPNFLSFILLTKFFQIPILNAFPPTKFYFSIFPYICLGWSLFILVIDFCKDRNLWKNTGTTFLVLFLISYGITCVLNFKYAFSDNVQLIFWMMLQYIIIYGCGRIQDHICYKKVMERLAKQFIAVTIFIALCSFVFFFLGIGAEIIVDGEPLRVGFRSRRLFGIYSSPNYGALYSVLSIVASSYFIARSMAWSKKIIYLFAALIEYYYLILSVSVSAQISLFIGIFLIVFGAIYSAFFQKHTVFKICVSTASAVVCAVLIVILITPIQNLSITIVKNLNTMPVVQTMQKGVQDGLEIFLNNIADEDNAIVAENQENSSSTVQDQGVSDLDEQQSEVISDTTSAQASQSENEKDVINFVEVDDDDLSLERGDFPEELPLDRRISHDRIPIWRDAVTLLFPQKPLFGVGALGYLEMTEEFFPDSFIAQYDKYSMHNDFVTLLVCCGLVGTMFMGCFIMLCVVKVIKYLNNYRKELIALKKIWYPLIVIVILAVSMLYSDAVLVNCATQSVVFWICLGYVMLIIDKEPKSKVFDIIDKIAHVVRRNG